MQRAVRVFAVVLLLFSASASLHGGAGASTATQQVRVDVFLSGNELFERVGSRGREPKAALGIPVVTVGKGASDLEDGEFRGLDDSPNGRTGCLFSASLAVSGSGPYTVTVGDADVGAVTSAQLVRLDSHLEIAIRTATRIVDSQEWRFPNSQDESSIRSPTQRKATPTPTAIASRTNDEWGCGDLEAYRAEMFSFLLSVENYDDVEAVLGSDDFTTIRPSVARRASQGLDEWADQLDAMDDVPRAAEDYHKAFIVVISGTSSVLTSYANGGTFAVLPYQDTLDQTSADLDAASRLGERRCGSDWTDVFGN